MSQLSNEMYAIEKRCYRLIRVVLKSLALWPYQQSLFSRVQKILFVIILVTCIMVQLLSFITMQYNRNLLFKIFWTLFPITFGMTKYCCFIIQIDVVKSLLEQIRNNWNLLKTKSEINIIEKYAYYANFCAIITIVGCSIFIFFVIIFQFWPIILNVLLPLNESRPYRFIAVAEYFISQEKYYYIILLYELLALYITVMSVCSIGIIFAIYIVHVCALLKIASYRMENVFEMSMLAGSKKEHIFNQRIIDAVILHRRAIKCIEYFLSKFSILYIILVAIGTTSLSFSFFQCFQLLTVGNNVTDLFITIILIVIHLIYIFFLNYLGQLVMDHGTYFFQATYNGLWYIASIHTQKLISTLMQIGVKNITLTVGYMLDASLPTLAMILNMAISYFMIMYQTL